MAPRFLTSSAVVVLGAYGRAQGVFDLSIEELADVTVTSVSKRSQEAAGAPAVVTVMRREEIATFGANSLYELLDRLPGFIAYNGTSPHVFSSVRGNAFNTNDRHLLILLNGRPVRFNAIFGSNRLLYNMLPVEVIERIEFVRGQGATLYGSNAISGMINIVTRHDEDDFVEMSGKVGSGGAAGGQVRTAQTFEDGSLFLNVAVEDRQDLEADFQSIVFVPPSTFVPTHRVGDVTNSVRTLTASGALGDFSFDVLLGERNGVNLDALSTSNPAEEESTFVHVGAAYEREISASSRVSAWLTYGTADTEIDTLDSESAALVGNVDLHWQPDAETNFLIGATAENVTGETIFPPPSRFIPDHDLWSIGVYFQVDRQVSEQLQIGGGVQWNKPEGRDSAIVPQAFAIWKPTDDAGIKLLWGQSFRSPDPRELYSTSTVQMGNPDLEPELAQNANLQLFATGERWRSELTFYWFDVDDLIRNQGGMFQNVGRVEHEGIELEGSWRVSDAFDLRGNANYLLDTDDTLAPDWSVKVGAAFDAGRFGRYGLWVTHFAEHQPTASLFPTTSFVNPEPDAYTLVSLKADYDVSDVLPGRPVDAHLQIYLSNILDEEYWHPVHSTNPLLPNTIPGGPAFGAFMELVVRF